VETTTTTTVETTTTLAQTTTTTPAETTTTPAETTTTVAETTTTAVATTTTGYLRLCYNFAFLFFFSVYFVVLAGTFPRYCDVRKKISGPKQCYLGMRNLAAASQ